MSGPSKLAGFVKLRVGTSNPSGNAEKPSQIDNTQRDQEDLDLREANKKKKRQEAQALKVTRSNITALAGEGGASALTNHAPDYKSVQDRSQSAGTYSVFGTDSQGADETSGFDPGYADADRAGAFKAAQELSDDSGDDYDSEEHRNVFEHADADGIDMASEARRLIAAVGPQAFGADPSSFVETLGNGTSYPPTTIGDFEGDDPTLHEVLQTTNADNHQSKHQHPFPERSSSEQLRQMTHVSSRLRPVAPNTRNSLTSNKPPNGAPFQNSFAIRRANDDIVTRAPVPQARSVPQSPQRQSRDSMQLNHFQHQSRNSTHNRPPVRTAQPMHVAATHDHNDDLHSDHSGESDEASLDYSMQDLTKKSYEELRNEDQDYDPRAKGLTLPQSINAGDLAAKCDHVKDLQPDQQTKFFAGLNLREWEEAGDWILERFGDVLKGFREVRTEKRKLAAEVEDRIYDRHKRIESRKRKVDEALAEMKASGVAVLDKTPRKKKK